MQGVRNDSMDAGPVLILGIGNTLLGDEGVGVRAALRIGEQCTAESGLRCLDGGTLSFTLAGDIEDASALVIIDAAELQAPPGTLRVFEREAMDAFIASRRRSSVHELSLLDLLAVASLGGGLPAQRALVGVQPACLDWCCELTGPVSAALPRVCERVWALLSSWDRTASPPARQRRVGAWP